MTGPLSAPVSLRSMRPDRAPDFIIGGAEKPYLLRWWLIPRNEVFNVYYHRFLRDDDDRALHDHPWPSLSVMTRGQMREITADGPKTISAGDVVFRPAEFAHRVELIDGAPCETLFVTGPKIREWGFHCPNGFVPWQDFVAADDKGGIGPGCGD